MTHVLCDQYIIDKQKALASPNKPLPADQDTTILPQSTVEVTTETISVAPSVVTETEPTKAATSDVTKSTPESSTTELVASTDARNAATVTVMLKIFTSTPAAPMEIAKVVPPPITTTPVSITSVTATVALTSNAPDLSDPSEITTQSTETTTSSKIETTTSSTETSDLLMWTSDSYVRLVARSIGTSPATPSLKPTGNQIREKPLTHKTKSVLVSGVASSEIPPTVRTMSLIRDVKDTHKTPKVSIHITKKSDIPPDGDPYDSAPVQAVKKRPQMKWPRSLPKTSRRAVHRLTQANPKTVKLTSSRTSEKVTAVRARPLTKVGKAPRSAQQKRYRSIAPSRAHVKGHRGIQATSPVRRRSWQAKAHRTKLTTSISKKAN